MIIQITNKLLAGFPKKFMNDTVAYFIYIQEDVIITEWLPDEFKSFTINLPCSKLNEKFR